jgi:hypothetical protein
MIWLFAAMVVLPLGLVVRALRGTIRLEVDLVGWALRLLHREARPDWPEPVDTSAWPVLSLRDVRRRLGPRRRSRSAR